MISFHATKLFHTCEGGALVFENSERSEELKRLQNFGFTGEDSFIEAGTNAKMYVKYVDANNDGLFIKLKKNASATVVQIA